MAVRLTYDRCLIIGLGNTCRADDGLGPAIVERLRVAPELAGAPLKILSLPALDITLSTELARFDLVIFVDARVDDTEEAVVVRGHAHSSGPPVPHNSSHNFSIDDLLRLARDLHGVAPRCFSVLARAHELSIKEGLSREAEAAADEAVERIISLLTEEAVNSSQG